MSGVSHASLFKSFSLCLFALILASCGTAPPRTKADSTINASEVGRTPIAKSAIARPDTFDTGRMPRVVVWVFDPAAELTIVPDVYTTGSALGAQFGFIGGLVGGLIDATVEANRKGPETIDGLDARLAPYRERIETLGFRNRLFNWAKSEIGSQTWAAGARFERRAAPAGAEELSKIVSETAADTIVTVFSQASFIEGLQTTQIVSSMWVYLRAGDEIREIDSKTFFHRATPREFGPRGFVPRGADLVAVRMPHWLAEDGKALKGAFTRGLNDLSLKCARYEPFLQDKLDRRRRQLAERSVPSDRPR